MRRCKMARFCAFLRFLVRFCAFFPAKMACKKAQICAEFCKNVQKALLCNTPFNYTPFCVSPIFSCVRARMRCFDLGALWVPYGFNRADQIAWIWTPQEDIKNLSVPLFLMGCFPVGFSRGKTAPYQEDVNGEKRTVKKWWIFGADFFHGLVPIFSRFTPIFSRFVRDINGEKKNISLLMIFFTVSFSRFAPSRP